MRYLGVFLLLIGGVGFAFGLFSGWGALFSWNGRHPVESRPLDEGLTTHMLTPVPGRRYTISVQVVFDREGREERDGIVLVEAKMPLVIRVKDGAGTKLAETVGWLDPNEPPNVLHGQGARPSRHPPELVVERLVGPFTAASSAPLTVEVDVEADRIGTARVVSRRLVIHDDAFPRSVWNAFVLAGVGGLAFAVGSILLALGFVVRRRRRRADRRGIPLTKSV